MLTVYLVLILFSLICFAAAAAGLWPKVNLLAAGLFFFTLVPFFQTLQRM